MQKIKAQALIEIGGFPKEHVEKTMLNIIENLKKDPNTNLIKSEIEKPQERKKIWLSLTEVELEFKDMASLTGFCFSYLPTSLEITDPENINFTSQDFTAFINDLIAKLNIYDDNLKKLIIQNKLMMKKLDSKASS